MTVLARIKKLSGWAKVVAALGGKASVILWVSGPAVVRQCLLCGDYRAH